MFDVFLDKEFKIIKGFERLINRTIFDCSVFFRQDDRNNKMVKISKSRRTLGRIALHRVKKYTNKVAQINNCRRKHKHNCIANILNEESFMAAIPNDINIDHEIHINENYYQYNTNPEESDISFSNNDEQLFVDENEINTIFDQF